jgi:hypothetical protein
MFSSSPCSTNPAYAEGRVALEPPAAERDVDTLAGLLSALHGLVALNRAQRLRPDHRDARVGLLVEPFRVR